MPHCTQEHRMSRLYNSRSKQDSGSQRVLACSSAPLWPQAEHADKQELESYRMPQQQRKSSLR